MVRLDNDAFEGVAKAVGHLKLSKQAYVSAAVLYFTQQELDPTQHRAQTTLPEMAAKLGELSLKIDTLQDGARKQTVDIANRLVSIWRTLERNLYTHLGVEQNALYIYLERIEENLISKASATESQYLWPLLERVIRGGTDGVMSRRMTNDLLQFIKVLVPEEKVPRSERLALNNEQGRVRDEEVMRQSQELLEGVNLTERVKSNRPSITTPPKTAIPTKQPTPPVAPPSMP